MNNNFDEKYIIELVKKELSKYLTEQGIEMKKQISFLGDDKDIEEKLSQKFEISENAGTLVVSKLSLKNLYNISNAIYENDYEEKIIKFLLENKEIIIIIITRFCKIFRPLRNLFQMTSGCVPCSSSMDFQAKKLFIPH